MKKLLFLLVFLTGLVLECNSLLLPAECNSLLLPAECNSLLLPAECNSLLLPVCKSKLLHSGVAHADEPSTIVLKAMVVNPSENEPQVVPIELPLPREAGKKDVVEKPEGLEVRYDSKEGVYKVMGEITLAPAEQKLIEVTIRDVWRIAEKDVQFQKGYLPTLMKSVEGTKYAGTAKQLEETINRRLDTILETQDEPLPPSKHIEVYRENLSAFSEVKKDVRFLEKLSAEKIPSMENAIQIESEELQKGLPTDQLKTITLKLQVKNPSDMEKALLPVDYYLPKEVKKSDIVNPGDLDIQYDLTRGAVWLHKEEVELGPGESKTYQVVIRDIWNVQPEKIQALEIKAAGFAQGLEGTKFEKSAVKLTEEISEMANQIVQNQSKTDGQPIDEHIAIFIQDLSLLSQMKEQAMKIARLETVETTTPKTTPENLGLESESAGQATTAASETPGFKGPEILARTIFEGKTPVETTVWKVIFAIIGFLGFVSLLFYILWWSQAKTAKAMGSEEVRDG